MSRTLLGGAPTLLAGLLAVSPVEALTCQEPDPVRSFKEAQAAPERFMVLVGQLDFDDSLLPPPVAEAPPPPMPDVPARLVGAALTTRDTLVPIGLNVLIRPSCAGPWCGWIPSGEYWLVFAREEDAGLVVEVGPCGGWAFMNPTNEQVAAVQACLAGGACEPTPP